MPYCGDRTALYGCPLLSEEGVARLSFTARIERPPPYRGGSASKKDGLAAPSSSFRGPARSGRAGFSPAVTTLNGAATRPAMTPLPAVDMDSFGLLELPVNFVRLFKPFQFSVAGSVRGNTMRRERNRR